MITTSDEVEEIFGVSIRELRNPGIRTFTKKEVRGEQVSVPCFEIRNQIIWGATAMMLAELVSVLDRL